jgi:hypothetical protein
VVPATFQLANWYKLYFVPAVKPVIVKARVCFVVLSNAGRVLDPSVIASLLPSTLSEGTRDTGYFCVSTLPLYAMPKLPPMLESAASGKHHVRLLASQPLRVVMNVESENV